MKYNFIKPTLIFALIGFFIPGFTAVIIIGLQCLLTFLGLECSAAFDIIFIVSGILAIISPVIFFNQIKYLINYNSTSLNRRYILFIVLEYIFIQACFIPFFTNGENLCHGKGGQVGLELVFTAWIALPILIIISLVYNFFFNSLKTNNDNRSIRKNN